MRAGRASAVAADERPGRVVACGGPVMTVGRGDDGPGGVYPGEPMKLR